MSEAGKLALLAVGMWKQSCTWIGWKTIKDPLRRPAQCWRVLRNPATVGIAPAWPGGGQRVTSTISNPDTKGVLAVVQREFED